MDSEKSKQSLNQMKTSIIKYWAPWCGPCKQLAPIIDQIASEYGVEVTSVNMDEEPEKARAAKIKALPTIHVYKDGVFEKSIVGGKSKAELVELIVGK